MTRDLAPFYFFIIFLSSDLVYTTELHSGSGSGSSGIDPTAPPPVPYPPPVYQDPPITYGNLTCDWYDVGDPICQQFFNYPVINNHSRGDFVTIYGDLQSIFGALGNTGAASICSRNAAPLLCHFTFPYCDPAYSLSVPVYQPLCRRDCELMRDFMCREEWEATKRLEGILRFGLVDRFNCELLEPSNGGEVPMCISTLDSGIYPYFSVPQPLATGPSCYSGNGRGYTGTVSVTASGHTCQIWGQPPGYLWGGSYPHPNYVSPFQYPELFSQYFGGPAHNYCRNPGEKGERPWCFTTNRTVRWEYCDIPKCAPGPTCQRYSGSLCRTNGSIGMDYIYIDTSIASQEVYESKLQAALNVLSNYPDCSSHLASFLCHSTFPLCDMTNPTPRPRKVCTSYCQSVLPNCGSFFEELRTFDTFDNLHPLNIPTNCTSTVPKDGGSAPECYDQITLTGQIIDGTTSCYNSTNKGVDYAGSVNVTVSGLPCQSWDLQEPHPHPFTAVFRRFLEGHNYCRNPEGRGLLPWCYTMNYTKRWEYCDIPACSVPMATDKPHLPIWFFPSVGAGGGVLVMVIIIFMILIICCCNCKRKSYSIKDREEMGVARGGESYQMSSVNARALPYKESPNPLYTVQPQAVSSYEDLTNNVKLPQYNRDKLTYICDLGEGHFGLVIRAEAEGMGPGTDKCTVAVKVLKEGASSTARTEFFKEAALMVGFDHQNILKLLGVCIEQEPLCMIFEYMELGDLNNFLRQNAPAHLHSFPCSGPKTLPQGLSTKNLVDMSRDVACGLAYLSTHHYVHRDLASRNCLVNGGLRVKIADFGLSQDVYSSDYFRLGESELLPIRWMPPEAIMLCKFTIDSDVWSYGVVLWEIFSYGIQPYYGMSNEEVIKYVRTDNVLRRPQGTPQEIYDLMLDCWTINPTDRPKAVEISNGLERWTPDLSAQIEVQSQHPDYQNMSTILEWARKSREVGQYHLLENTGDEGTTSDVNGATPTNNGVPPTLVNGAYDHLSPPTGCDKVINNDDEDVPIY